MRSKLKASRLLAAAALTAGLAGGGVLGVTAVAGAQTGGDQPPAEADRPPGGHSPGLDAAAKALNLSVDDLRSKLEGNKTIAQVAQEQGVDVQTVIDAMVADATAHIDQAVQDGKLTADQANERKSNLQDRITKLVNEGKPKGDHGPKLDAAAKALNVSVDDLRSKLKDGKTLAQVAKDQGVDVQKVIDAMVADATAHIDQAVKDGKLTADQATQRKSGLKDRITKLVNDGPPKDRGAGAPRDGGGPGGPPDSSST
jgi:ribosomal protein S20